MVWQRLMSANVFFYSLILCIFFIYPQKIMAHNIFITVVDNVRYRTFFLFSSPRSFIHCRIKSKRKRRTGYRRIRRKENCHSTAGCFSFRMVIISYHSYRVCKFNVKFKANIVRSYHTLHCRSQPTVPYTITFFLSVMTSWQMPSSSSWVYLPLFLYSEGWGGSPRPWRYSGCP